ncbi:DNA polymerase/3'-5' exonuclease PolX [Streptomyces sp. RB6PN25]|uniref:DNA polymerase beta n=1 Tax=Streptomyces humicola TaxID=2953240 RepID=A0ABT1PPP1_9ACTN|nr:DNA polymerase/3'-5' exonuclease PolX [Streptomyces humicola]MCQ4079652.1 DNA polymerase/3'-5' exonuclease PolX [Streptomyces humicola]
MARPNKEVEALLQEYADLVSITGGDAYRARAYEKAARAIGGYPTDVSRLDAKHLREIPNVGKSIADKVEEYLRTGHMAAVEDVRAQIPAGVRELIAIPTLGPKKAMSLYQELHISSVDELADAIQAEKLRNLKGFGPKTEENILHGIKLMQSAGDRVQIGVAMELAEDVVAAMERVAGCEQCTYAGSLRRMKETIGDIDVLVAAADSAPFMEAVTRLPYLSEVIAHGEKKTSIRTNRGLQVDLRVVPPDSWGAALQYFTGSKAHNIRTRELAVHQKLKLSEYGLFHAGSGRKIVSRTEDEVYARLGLPWIPPTLREDRGEIAAGLRGELPELVTDADMRGDLHTHTDLTDGMATLEQMIAAAAERGYAYYAITDHAPDLYMQRMTDDKILQQRDAVRHLDGKHKRMRLLHGTELNIGPSGDVDWPEDFLADFDLCVASIHSHFNQDRDALTRRLIRACAHPCVNIIGHPTTRHIGKRPPLDIDLDEVFAACARTGTALEINGQPERLDLSDENIMRAKRHGVKFAIDSDAHSTLHLDYLRYGVGTAQRAWLTAEDVINTWPLGRLRRFLDKDRPRKGRPGEGRTSRPAGGRE